MKILLNSITRTSHSNVSCVYKVVNLVNGKFYIGSTINLSKRMFAHSSSPANNSALGYPIQKYGKSNFEVEILFQGTKKEIILQEQKYLDSVNIHAANCYNRSTSATTYDFADPILKEHHLKAVLAKNQKKVYQYSINGDFIASHDSMIEAARSLGKTSHGKISMCCSGKRRTAFGFQWSKENLPSMDKVEIQNNDKIPIIALSKIDNTALICFRSIYQAAKFINDSESKVGRVGAKIKRCLNNPNLSAYGFRWSFIS